MISARRLAELSELAIEREQCSSHARRPEHHDPDRSPPPEAVALWVARNGGVDMLCRSCFRSWLDNAVEDPDLSPAELTFFRWSRPRTYTLS